MQSNKKLFILPFLLSLLLAGCSTANPLDGTNWYLLDLNGQAALPGRPVTLIFEADQINGTDGCNLYGGPVTVKGSTFNVGADLVRTEMACEEVIMQQADAYYRLLDQVVSYVVTGQRLTLLDGSGDLLATFAAQSRSLGGTAWIVTAYTDAKGTLVDVLSGTEQTASFGLDGSLSGSGGCNGYSSTYETEEDRITVGMVASTLMFCAEPAGLMDQESQFFQALQTAATFRIDQDQLELMNTAGVVVVTLVKSP